MFTRCPECLTVHTLNASLLAHAGGAVRCGRCNREFSALAFLFDHWPDADKTPPGIGTSSGSPVLGQVGPAADTAGSKNQPETIEVSSLQDPGEDDSNRAAWVTIFILLLFITASNLAWTFREPLLKNREVRNFLVDTGIMEPPVTGAYRDTSRFHLVSRDMHQHPARTGMLALSFTFVNRAKQAQPYPSIELILTDAGNQPLARREFTVAEYLPAGTGPAKDLAPNIHVPVLLEFADPGVNAVGFELRFQ